MMSSKNNFESLESVNIQFIGDERKVLKVLFAYIKYWTEV